MSDFTLLRSARIYTDIIIPKGSQSHNVIEKKNCFRRRSQQTISKVLKNSLL